MPALTDEASPPIELTDKVGTLALSEELDARGNLGGVTIDALGYVYMANFRDKLWRISPEGEVRLLTDALYGASGNAVDSQGRVYQANFLGHTITRIDRTGEVSTFATSLGLKGPVGIAIDPKSDTVYVCNCQGNSIARISPEGAAGTLAESELFACPNGITFADDGNLYVTSFNGPDIVRVTPSGETSSFAKVPGGAGNAHLVFHKGFFYVTKILSNTVVKVSMEGEVFPVATIPVANGIAVDPRTDRLYVGSMEGEYTKAEPSRLTLYTIDLVSLSGVLKSAMEGGGLDAAREAYRAYKADEVRGQENTAAEMVTFAYSFLSKRKIAEALAFFQMNAESYPADANAQFHLGEAYRYTGQAERAAEQYRRVLEIDPEHANAKARLELLAQ
jgi:sugar lactone lactonase YvrE